MIYFQGIFNLKPYTIIKLMDVGYENRPSKLNFDIALEQGEDFVKFSVQVDNAIRAATITHGTPYSKKVRKVRERKNKQYGHS